MRALLRYSIPVVLATACGFPPPPDVPEAPQDGSMDTANPDVSMVPRIVASNTVSRADLVAGIAPFTVPAGKTYVIDTDQGSMFDAGNGNAPIRVVGEGVQNGVFYRADDKNRAFFAVQSLTIGANAILRGVGTRALILVADGTVEIKGIIDVSAGHCTPTTNGPACAGPGGGRGEDNTTPAAGCSPGRTGGMSTASSSGGGGGGFGSPGAAGGASNLSGFPIAGGIGGTGANCPGPALDPIQGGSGGAKGAGFSTTAIGGGGGGGAVQITSFTSISFVSPAPGTCGVWAGGAGGTGGQPGGSGPIGGSAGGAGGGIVLEAVAIDIGPGVVVAANGGGGGAGTPAADGGTGEFGSSAAPGGAPVNAATGAGGSGAALDVGAGNGGDAVAVMQTVITPAGGGGGGGAGRIRINAVTLTSLSNQAIVSPTPSLNVPARTQMNVVPRP